MLPCKANAKHPMIQTNQSGKPTVPSFGTMARKARNVRTLTLGARRSQYGLLSKQILINKITSLLQDAIPEGNDIDVVTFQAPGENKLSFSAGDFICVIDFSLTNKIYSYEKK